MRGVGDRRVFQAQIVERRERSELLEDRVADARVGQIQAMQMRQALQMRKIGIGDGHLGQIDRDDVAVGSAFELAADFLDRGDVGGPVGRAEVSASQQMAIPKTANPISNRFIAVKLP